MKSVTISTPTPEQSSQPSALGPVVRTSTSSEQLARFESTLSDEDVDGEAMWLFARSVQDQIHDQYRQF